MNARTFFAIFLLLNFQITYSNAQGLHQKKQSFGILMGFGKTPTNNFQTRFLSVTKPLGRFILPEIGLQFIQQNYTTPRLQTVSLKHCFFTTGLTFRKTIYTLHSHKKGSKYNAQAFELFATPEMALPFQKDEYFNQTRYSVKTGIGLFHLQQKGRATNAGLILKLEGYYRFVIPTKTTALVPQASEIGLQIRVLHLRSHTFYKRK